MPFLKSLRSDPAFKDFTDEELLQATHRTLGGSIEDAANTLGLGNPSGGITAQQVSSSIDRYQAGLYGVGEAAASALGADQASSYFGKNRKNNELQADIAEGRAQRQGGIGSWEDVHGLGDFGSYIKGVGIQSLPYAAEAITGGALARGAMAGTRAALAGAKTLEEVAALKRTQNLGSLAGATAASYPSSLGDILQNQREQTGGTTNLLTASALAIPYAAFNALGETGLLAKGTLPKNPLNILDSVSGFKGGIARAGAALVKTGAEEAVGETGQEVINQLGRMSVDPNATLTDPEALQRYKESAIGGFALGGLMGGATGWRRSQEGKQEPTNDISTALKSKDVTQPDITTANFTLPPAPPVGTPDMQVAPAAPTMTAPAVVGGTTDIAQAQAQAQAAQQQQQMQEQQQAAREEFTQRFGGVRPALDENGQPTQSVVFQNKTYHTRDELNAAVDKFVAKDQTKDDHARQVQAAFTKTYSTQEKTPNVNSVVSQTSRYTNGTASVDDAASRINTEIATLVGQGKKLDDTKLSKLAEFYENLTGVVAPAYVAAEQAQPTGVKNDKLQTNAGLREVPVSGGTTETIAGGNGLVRPTQVQPVGATSIGAGPLSIQAGQPSTGGIRPSAGNDVIANDGGSTTPNTQVSEVTNGQTQTTTGLGDGGQVSGQADQVADVSVPSTVGGTTEAAPAASAEKIEHDGNIISNLYRQVLTPTQEKKGGATLDQRVEMVRLALNEQASEAEIAELTGLSITTVDGQLRRLGVVMRPQYSQSNLDLRAAVAERLGISAEALAGVEDIKVAGVARPSKEQKQAAQAKYLSDSITANVTPEDRARSVSKLVSTYNAVGEQYECVTPKPEREKNGNIKQRERLDVLFQRAADAYISPEFPQGIPRRDLLELVTPRRVVTSNETIADQQRAELEGGSQDFDNTKYLSEEMYGSDEDQTGKSMGTIASAGGSQGAVETQRKADFSKIEKLQSQMAKLPVGDVESRAALQKQLDIAYAKYHIRTIEAVLDTIPKASERSEDDANMMLKLYAQLDAARKTLADAAAGNTATSTAAAPKNEASDDVKAVKAKFKESKGDLTKFDMGELQLLLDEANKFGNKELAKKLDAEMASRTTTTEAPNAIQVESTDAGNVREPTRGSEKVGQANAEPQEPAGEGKAEAQVEEVKTPKEQYDVLSAATDLLPPYETLDARERAQVDDQAYQGELTLASLNTMFSGNARFGKDVRAKNPYTVAELTKEIENFVRTSISARKLTIVNSVEDLTESTDKVVQQIGSVIAIEGAYGVAVNGRAFLIANRIEKGMGRAKFMHEVGAHLGLENLLPKATYDRLVAQVKNWTNSDADTNEVTLAARAEMRVLNANTPDVDYDAELLAYFIEEAVQAGINPTASGKETGALRGWFRTLWAAFKVAMRKLGYNPESMTAQDIVDMAFGAARLEMAGTFHGTAASFRNFRDKFVGSGEGATAYGWGTYLAERYGIAKGYHEADVRRKTKKGTPAKPEGNLMRVDTSVADDELFNYNVAVADQPQHVKDAIKSLLDPIADEVVDRTNTDVDELTGRDLFGTGENDLGLLSRLIMDDILVGKGAAFDKATQQGEFHKAASLLLEEAGIAGIKHLDARSRGTATKVIQFRGKSYNRDELRDAARAAYVAKDDPLTFEMSMLRSLLQNGVAHVKAMHQSKQAYYERLFYKMDKESAERFKLPFDEAKAQADAERKTKDLFETKALDWLAKHEYEISLAENPRTYNRILFSDKNIFRVGSQVAANNQRMRFGKNMSTVLNEGLDNHLPAAVVRPAKSVTATMAAAVKNGLLYVGITEDVVNAASKYMRSAQDYLTAQYARQGTRLDFEQRIEAILDSFDKLPKHLQGEGAGSVNRFILDSTMSKKWGFYPGEHRIGTTLFEVDPDLEKRFKAFEKESPAAAQLIRDVFEHGYTALKAKSDAIDAAVEREFAERTKAAQGDADLMDEVAAAKKLMRTQLSNIQNVDFTTPYAYLGRYGDYVVAAKSAEFKYWESVAAEKGENKERAIGWLAENTSNPDHYVVQFAETQGEADAMAAELIATGKYDMDGTEAGPKEDVGSFIGSDVHLAVARLRNLITRQEGEGGEGSAELNRMVSDLYLMTAAENSARKSEIMRKYVAGANGNMMRNLATSGRADAHFLSTMKHNDDVVDALERMRNEAKGNVRNAMPIYNELFKRQTDSLEYKSPSTLSVALTRATSVWFLATSPAFYLQQMLQTTVLSLPYMSGRLGYFRSARAIKAAYGDVATLVKGMGINEHIDFSKAPEDVRAMLQTLVGMGKIDIGIDADAKARAGEHNVLNTVMRKLQGVNNRIEAVNRATAAIAAYRGYIQRYGAGNTDAATKFAAEVVSNTHGSYDGFNTPRVLNNDLGRLAGQFKRFQIIQLSMMGKLINTSFKGASPEERMVARRALAFITGHMAVLGGALGVPFVQQVAARLLDLFGDDDEPKDLEYKLRQAIGDETMANLLLNGVPAAMGVNLGGKLGMGNVASILPFTDVDLSTRSGYEKMAVGLLGPFLGGLAPKFIDGAGMVAKGEYYKGLELLMPNGIGNAMKGVRYANEGITMRNGDVVLKPEEISMLDAAFQAVGLPTTTITGRQYTQKVTMEFDKFYAASSADIKGAYVNASRSGDTESMAEARKDWEDLQASRRKNGYTVQPMSELFKATVAARKREAGVVDGVETNKANKAFVKNII